MFSSKEYDPLTKSITDFVLITANGTGIIWKVDADGGANGSYIKISAFLQISSLNSNFAARSIV